MLNNLGQDTKEFLVKKFQMPMFSFMLEKIKLSSLTTHPVTQI